MWPKPHLPSALAPASIVRDCASGKDRPIRLPDVKLLGRILPYSEPRGRSRINLPAFANVGSFFGIALAGTQSCQPLAAALQIHEWVTFAPSPCGMEAKWTATRTAYKLSE